MRAIDYGRVRSIRAERTQKFFVCSICAEQTRQFFCLFGERNLKLNLSQGANTPLSVNYKINYNKN
jgi:hypothetical protein